MSYTECDQEDLYSWHWTHYSDVLEDDPILHRHFSLRTNPRLPHGFPSEPCSLHDGRRPLGGNLVPHLPHYSDHTGPFSSPTSLCRQQTVSCRSFLGLRNLLCQFSAPGVLRPPHHFGNGTRSGVPGLLHWVRTFRTALQPPTWLQPGYGTILRITFGGAIIRLRLTTLFGRQMCAPCPGTDSRFCRIASFVQSSRFLWIRSNCRCQAYSLISTHFFTVVKSVAAPILLCLRLTFHFHVDVSPLTGQNHVSLHVFDDFQAGSTSICPHLHCWTFPASRDGFFISYNVNSDSRTGFSSISSRCTSCVSSTTPSNGLTATNTHSQHWTDTSTQHRCMEPTWRPPTDLFWPDQSLYWCCTPSFAWPRWWGSSYGWFVRT